MRAQECMPVDCVNAGCTLKKKFMLLKTSRLHWVRALLLQPSDPRPVTTGGLAQMLARSCKHHSG